MKTSIRSCVTASLTFLLLSCFAPELLAQEAGPTIKTGGYFRWSEEWFNHPNFGQGVNQSQGYFLQRYLAHVDIQDKENNIRWYFQLKYSEIADKYGSLSPLDQDDGDFHQVFFENEHARIGRQEVILGSALLIGVREGPNSRLSFDGAKIFSKSDQQWEFFAGHPVDISRGFMDNKSSTELVASFYLTSVLKSEEFQEDFYLIYYENNSNLYTIGTRVTLQSDTFNWDTDVMLQTGTWQEQDALSYGMASRFKRLWGVMDVSLLVSYFSGDKDAEDGALNTFNSLFPKGQYYGWSAEIGHPNLIALQPGITWHLNPQLHWTNSLGFFWRENIHDGVYRGNGQLLRASTNDKRFIGTQINSSGEWSVNKIWSLYFEYTFFTPGEFIRDSSDSQDSQFFAVRTALRF